MEFLAELSQFSWREANWLWGLGFPLIWWLYQAWLLRRQQTDYAQAEFWPWVLSQKSAQRRFNILPSLIWFALILALAGPRFEQTELIESDRAGVDVLVVMDASRSMSAQDQKPNRFQFSQTLIESLSQQLNAQDRIGLINYSAQAHWVTPFTQDKSLFKRALYLTESNLLPLAGSQLTDSLSFALQQAERQKNAPLVLLLVTDGGGLGSESAPDSSQLRQLKTQLQQQDAELILLAVGKTQTVWLADDQHPSGWLHDDNQPVDVALPRVALQNLSQQLNAKYLEASGDAAMLDKLLDPIRAKAERLPVNQTKTEQWDLAPWLMGLALGLLMIILQLPKPGYKRVLPGLSMLGLGLFSLLSFTPNPVWAASTSIEQQAYQAFEAKDFDQAERIYASWLETAQADQQFKALLGAGNAAYRQTQYARALTWYRQAVLNARQDQARAQALFNLGNAYAQLEIWGLAVESFEAVSLYQTEHAKAQQNLTLALAALTEKQAKATEQAEAEQTAKQQEGLRKDLEGSFHGGSKPDPNNEAGSGAEGESDDGRSEGVGFSLPERLAGSELLTGQDWALAGSAKSVEEQLKSQRRIDNLQMELKNLEDDQQALLKHLFEREAGFQARQEKVHVIPGVEPW